MFPSELQTSLSSFKRLDQVENDPKESMFSGSSSIAYQFDETPSLSIKRECSSVITDENRDDFNFKELCDNKITSKHLINITDTCTFL